MEELNEMNLDELLHSSNNSMSGRLFEKADIDVLVSSEDSSDKSNKELAMSKIAEYESVEQELSKLDAENSLAQQELDSLIQSIRENNKDLIDKINDIANRIDVAKKRQETIKEELLPLQRAAFKDDSECKTLVINKIQSTYVEPTEKNQFDLKKFRAEQEDFWKNNLSVLQPYATISPVSDYVRITVKKK